MKLIGKVHRLRRHQAAVAKASLVFSILISCANATGVLYAATVAEVATKIKSLKPQERTSYLLKGAQAEGELVYYGTLPIDEFLPLARVFNGRYRSIALQHYFSPRDGILSRTLTEARAGRHAADVIQVDLSYGYQLLNANLVQPHSVAVAKRFYDGTYDPGGYWHSMYYLTTALLYNTNSIKAEQAPKSYDELLSPAWKGKMLFDPEADIFWQRWKRAGGEKRQSLIWRSWPSKI
jgi:iron(III) transport system substrate-binding protein